MEGLVEGKMEMANWRVMVSEVVEEPHGVAVAIEEEFNWFNEGLEGEDLDDDVFGVVSPPHSVPPKPNTVPPESNNDPLQPTADTPQPTINTLQPNTNAPSTDTDTPQPNTIPPPYINVDEEWAEPALKDGIASMNGSDDEQRSSYPEFNEETDMRNVNLVKGMKFPNPKVFRNALRECVFQKHIDIKWKLNEKKKISVHCKNKCGWRCYTSMVSGECIFQIRTLNLEGTCYLTFQNSQVISSYVVNRY